MLDLYAHLQNNRPPTATVSPLFDACRDEWTPKDEHDPGDLMDLYLPQRKNLPLYNACRWTFVGSLASLFENRVVYAAPNSRTLVRDRLHNPHPARRAFQRLSYLRVQGRRDRRYHCTAIAPFSAETPKDYFMPNYEDLTIDTADHNTIHAWLIKRRCLAGGSGCLSLRFTCTKDALDTAGIRAPSRRSSTSTGTRATLVTCYTMHSECSRRFRSIPRCAFVHTPARYVF